MCISGVPSQRYHGNNGRSWACNACEVSWATASLQREAKGAGQTSKEAWSSVSMTLSSFPWSSSPPFLFRDFKSTKNLKAFASSFQMIHVLFFCCSNLLRLHICSISEFLSVCLRVYICVCKQEGGNTSQPSAKGTRAAKEAETHPRHRSSVLIWGPKKSQVSITQPIYAGWL